MKESNYVGCSVLHIRVNNAIYSKLWTFQYIHGIIWCTFKASSKETLLRWYMVVVVPTLLYWCGNMTLLQQHARSTETAEMKFFMPVAQCTLYDHKINGKRRTKYQYIQFAWNYCGLYIPVDITFTNSEWYTRYQVDVWIRSCWQKTHRSTKEKKVRQMPMMTKQDRMAYSYRCCWWWWWWFPPHCTFVLCLSCK